MFSSFCTEAIRRIHLGNGICVEGILVANGSMHFDITARMCCAGVDMFENVVVVEDDENTRLLLEFSLTREGYRVTVASDGIEGLEIIRGHTPDVVVTNLNMPRLDGIGLIKRIRNDLHLTTLPIIVLSGARNQDPEVLVTAGASVFLCKPVDLTKLSECVKMALNSNEPV